MLFRSNSTTQHNHNVAVRSTAKRKLSAFSSESDDDTEEILARAQRLDEQKRKQNVSSNQTTTTPESKSRMDIRNKSRPRNPFTLMKEEEDCFENIYKMNFSNAAAGSRNVLQGEASNNNLLWSDDSEEECHRRNKKIMSITATKKRKSKDTKKIEPQKTLDSKSSTTAQGGFDEEVDKNVNTEEDDDSQKRSHPYFDHPKFGPYDPPVPFVLRSSDSDVNEVENDATNNHVNTSNSNHQMVEQRYNYQVPASINRYLPDYQRAGIEFMYRCGIVTKGGAILGDGTNFSCFSYFICRRIYMFTYRI